MNNNRCVKAVERASLAAAVSMAVLLPELALAQAQIPASAGPTLALEEVVITARKRTESLQDVPMSVTALSPEEFEGKGYIDLSAIGEMTPGLYFEAFDATRPLIYVRGIGTRAYDAGSDPSVGVFVDGAYSGRFGSLNMALLDVQQIEVLKGPQGTLYGRNTIGGAISVTTKDPADSLEIDVSGEVGGSAESGDGIWATNAALSTPLIEDELSMRVAVAAYNRDGYVKVEPADVKVGGLESYSGRATFLWTPAEQFDARLYLNYSKVDFPPISFNNNDLGGPALPPGPLAPGVEPVPATGKAFKALGNRSDIDLDREVMGGVLKLNWEAEYFELTSISSLGKLKIREFNELDGTSLAYSVNPIREDTDSFSQELRFAGDSEDFSWLLGGYYGRDKIDRTDSIILGPDSLLYFLSNNTSPDWDFGIDVQSTAYAGFGQVNWHITDRLALTVGLRHSYDKKEADYDTRSNTPAFVPNFKESVDDDWTSTDSTVSLSYDFTDEIMGYATYSTGYKPGGFQFIAQSPAQAQQVFQPEEVQSYEVGVKSTLLDQRLQLNAAAFYMDYTDLQLLRVIPGVVEGVPLVVISNAGESTIQGFEFEGSALLTENLTLDFGFAYLDAEFDKYQFSQELDFSGNKLPRAPEYGYTLALRYEHALGAGDLRGSLLYSWQDDSYFEADNDQVDPDSSQKAHGMLDASVAYAIDAWTFSLWGTNLLDEEYRRSVLNQTGFAQLQVFAPPATAGVKISYSFR